MSTWQRQLRLFLTPYVVVTLLLTVLPALATVSIAFFSYQTISNPVWVGLGNFQRILESDLVRLSLRNSFIFLLTVVPLRTAIALGLALMLHSDRKPFGLYRAAVYLPTILPETAYALVWLWILNPVYGPLNIFLRSLSLPTPPWLSRAEAAVGGMILLSLFQIGEGLLVLLAGLQTVPAHLYDAAKVDGANGRQIFGRITLPILLPWLVMLGFRDLIVSLQSTFAPSFVITYGGPYYATTFVPLLIYEIAFDIFDIGLAAAVLVLTYVLIAMIILGVLNLLGERVIGRANEV